MTTAHLPTFTSWLRGYHPIVSMGGRRRKMLGTIMRCSCGWTWKTNEDRAWARRRFRAHKAEATGKAPKGHVSMAQQQIDAIQVGDQVPVRFEGTTLPTVMATVTAIDGKILRIQYDAGAPIFAGLRGMIRLPGWTKG